MEDCIFCKMFTGEVEPRKVYEAKDVLGVLDIQPRLAHGQCLLLHRRHVPQFYDLKDEEIAQLFKGVKAVAEKIKKVFNTPLVSILSRGIGIPIHAHVIVYPSTEEGPMERMMAGLLAFEQVRTITATRLDEIAEEIRAA